MAMTRRAFVAGAGAGAAFLAAGCGGVRPAAPAGKRVTLLHLTDTHAQLETHPEYVPGETPDVRLMGGYARLKTAIDRERAAAGGRALWSTGATSSRARGRPRGPRAR